MADRALLTGADLTALGVAAAARRAFESAQTAAAVSLEGFRGNLAPLDPLAHGLRPQPGQAEAAAGLMRRLGGSALTRAGAARRVQDPLSLRCVAQIYGRGDAGGRRRGGDRRDQRRLGQPGGAGGNGRDRQPWRLSDRAPERDALGAGAGAGASVGRAGGAHGFTGLPDGLGVEEIQSADVAPVLKSAEALAAEIVHLAQPVPVYPGGAADGAEDLVAHSAIPAKPLLAIVERLDRLVALELIIGVQSVERRRLETVAPAVAAAAARVRETVAPVVHDRGLGDGDRAAGGPRRRRGVRDASGVSAMAAIWVERPTLEGLHDIHIGTAPAHLGIEFTEVGDDWLAGRMPVDQRTVQPYRILHGGASVLLAETLGSSGAVHCVDRARFICVGQEINANHLRPAATGWVTGVARPIHLGRRSQVWGIELRDEAGRMTCISRLTVAVLPSPDAQA